MFKERVILLNSSECEGLNDIVWNLYYNHCKRYFGDEQSGLHLFYSSEILFKDGLVKLRFDYNDSGGRSLLWLISDKKTNLRRLAKEIGLKNGLLRYLKI